MSYTGTPMDHAYHFPDETRTFQRSDLSVSVAPPLDTGIRSPKPPYTQLPPLSDVIAHRGIEARSEYETLYTRSQPYGHFSQGHLGNAAQSVADYPSQANGPAPRPPGLFIPPLSDDDNFPPASMLPLLPRTNNTSVQDTEKPGQQKTNMVKSMKRGRSASPVQKRKNKSATVPQIKAEPKSNGSFTGKGRKGGSANYSQEDTRALLDIVQRRLPTGTRAWEKVASEFNDWAKSKGRPSRKQDMLVKKYKKLANTTKPTGDAVIPEAVERAKAIEILICDESGTRDVSDQADGDSGCDSSDDSDIGHDSDSQVPQPPVKKARKVKEEPGHGPLLRRKTSSELNAAPARGRTSVTQNLLGNISNMLDPTAQAQRQEQQMAGLTQVLAFTNQIRDLQQRNDKLVDKITDLQKEVLIAERKSHRAFYKLISERNQGHSTPRGSVYAQRVFYRDGGECMRVVDMNDKSSDAERDAEMFANNEDIAGTSITDVFSE